LELFAFVKPARFALPTPLGIAEALGLPLPSTPERAADSLRAASRALLADLAAEAGPDAVDLASVMTDGGWPWGPAVLAALGAPDGAHSASARNGLRVWSRLRDWQDTPPEPAPGNQPVDAADALHRLAELLGPAAEKRQGQRDYAASSSAAFQPRNRRDEPNIVLAEAGTGIGKTLGYVAPASRWSELNQGAVWISTFTRNLQRQLDSELDRLCPVPAEKQARVVIRKGRENYLCLLNLADAVNRLPVRGSADAVALGLIARWAGATRDGDMVGGDFPAWLVDLLGARHTWELTDTRGECIYSSCDHYRKCFIERTIRRARTADIVVANHALVMVQAAMGGGEEGTLPLRYVFDEGHHLFDAADSAFSAHLSGRETADLRRWILGPEGGRGGGRSRGRGLRERAQELIAGDDEAERALDEALAAARALPGGGWGQRIGGGEPVGPAETFLARVRQQVYARDRDPNAYYDLETETRPPVDGLLDAADRLEGALKRLEKPLGQLVQALMSRLDTDADDLDTATRARIEGLARGITRRGLQALAAWRAMLQALRVETPPEFVDWFGISRIGGRDADVGFHRHWLDPTQPLAETVYAPAHGVLVTSASLRDQAAGNPADEGWPSADGRVGVNHIRAATSRAAHPSPFDYAGRSRVLVVGDVGRNDADAVAAAYRELFVAAAGGGLGLFTAISRLRAVYERIAGPLEAAGLPLLAQHIDPMDTGNLIDIFRSEKNTCLLGTDAVRDGVDVPGPSLRLIVFDRVPWPRPTVLHRARKAAGGGRGYDEMLTRLKLKQAYGRLLRRQDDRGVFVMLDRGLPSRLLDAFPDGVDVTRLGLAEAIAETRSFFADPGA
ncbi:MAG: ATP-dependent DNA helicase, partial [Magnetovibrio sp.]|nr:ATP-dependent DNA helicase [Magnetovibrio sp.]